MFTYILIAYITKYREDVPFQGQRKCAKYKNPQFVLAVKRIKKVRCEKTFEKKVLSIAILF